MGKPLLSVRDLETRFESAAGPIRSVNGISFSIDKGEVLGIVGESGSGKSVTGFSLMGLVDHPGRVAGGSILFDGQELVGLPPEQMRRLRGKRIAMIFQDPMMTLNPVLRIDTQMVEAISAHSDMPKKQAEQRCIEALDTVGIPAPTERFRSYPHQLSGGMRQRVAIAIALLNEPDLIIADEPTTALDVTVQAQILAEAQRLVETKGVAMMWITHDLSVVAGLADRIAVMYAGKIVEQGPANDIVETPRHPYTVGLIASVPSRNRRGTRLMQIPGVMPSPLNLPDGCPFRTRCPKAQEICRIDPPEGGDETGHRWLCHFPVQPGEKLKPIPSRLDAEPIS
jgi:peptide/nickel transport system ATP-binding protein